jgi:hypothetical protein
MQFLATLSLFLAASMATPVTPINLVPRNETSELEARQGGYLGREQVYMVNCWNYGVEQSWLFVRTTPYL